MMHINSPRTDDDSVEQEIRSKGLNAPRITPQDVEAAIASEHYFTAAEGFMGHAWATMSDSRGVKPPAPLELVTICVLVLKNGFTIVGHSACASPENFDAAIGRKIARQNATQQIWPLLGYALKNVLAFSGKT